MTQGISGDYSKFTGLQRCGANLVMLGVMWSVTSSPDLANAQILTIGANSGVYAAIIDGSGKLYIGGAFTVAGYVNYPQEFTLAQRIATWNGTDWSALGSGMNGTVKSLAIVGNDLYTGGAFTTAGGNPANHIAKWDGSNWSPIGSGVNGLVSALAGSGSNLCVGGSFSVAGGNAVNNIAKWDGRNWSALGSGVNSEVRALAVSGGNLYAAGLFTTAGDTAAKYIAKWDGTNWSAVGSGVTSNVYAIAASGGNLYAGGSFTAAGGNPANHIAKWDGSQWSPLGGGVGATVLALAVSGTNLYAGGLFTTAGGNAANHIAKWDGSSWASLGSGMEDVRALVLLGTNLYAGGFFTGVGTLAAESIARWDGRTWSLLAPRTSAPSFHDVFLANNPTGPDGTARAHVGDLIASTIALENADRFLDTITFTNVFDVVEHGTGTVVSPNLLPQGPLTLDFYHFFYVTNTYRVLPEDGANNPYSGLADEAWAYGLDNHNGLNGTFLRQWFLLRFPGQVFIVRPCLRVTISCVPGIDDTISYSGSISNCGNTPLTNLVVSNFFNGVFVWVLGPTNLATNQTIYVTNQYQIPALCQPVSATLCAWGTDELGLTVSDSATATCSIINTNPPRLNCPVDKTVDYGTTWTFDSPTVEGGATNVTLATLSTVTNVSGGRSFTVTRTWAATDACSNRASCTQTVTVFVGAPIVSPTLFNVTLTGAELHFSFLSQPGIGYVLEANGLLGETGWQPVQTILATGTMQEFKEPVTSLTNRFYRLHIP